MTKRKQPSDEKEPRNETDQDTETAGVSEALGGEPDPETNEGEPTPSADGDELLVVESEAEEESAAAIDSDAELSSQLEVLQTQAEEYLEGWQRARAEFANYKKRVDKEMQEAYVRAAGDILARYLYILDDLERALKDRPKDEEAALWAEGIELIYNKMESMLEAEGVEAVPAQGKMFDPTLHEAISHEESEDHNTGQVIDVIRQGYTLGDRVLRPALVRVAK